MKSVINNDYICLLTNRERLSKAQLIKLQIKYANKIA